MKKTLMNLILRENSWRWMLLRTKVLVEVNPPLKLTGRRLRESQNNCIEAPIDLMSYYEMFKDKMGDYCVVAMNGLRKESISTAFCEIALGRNRNLKNIYFRSPVQTTLIYRSDSHCYPICR